MYCEFPASNLYATLDISIVSYLLRGSWFFYFLQLDFEGSLSPVIAPKKARPSEAGSDEVRDGSLLKIRAWGGAWLVGLGFFKGKAGETPSEYCISSVSFVFTWSRTGTIS